MIIIIIILSHLHRTFWRHVELPNYILELQHDCGIRRVTITTILIKLEIHQMVFIISFDLYITIYFPNTFNLLAILSCIMANLFSVLSSSPCFLYIFINVNMIDYLKHIVMVNQLVALSSQLRHDVSTLNNHKYIAHQIALLYVSEKRFKLSIYIMDSNKFNCLYFHSKYDSNVWP